MRLKKITKNFRISSDDLGISPVIAAAARRIRPAVDIASYIFTRREKQIMEKPKKSMFRLSNTAFWSFVTMVLGAVLGMVIPDVMIQLRFIGDVWIDSIQMMMIPLVFCIVTLAIGKQEDAGTLGRVAGKIAIYYILTTVVAVCIGLALATLINPAQGVDLSAFQGIEVDGDSVDFTLVSFITGLFSDNIFAAFAEGNLLQTMVAALLIGVATLRLKDKALRDTFIRALDSVNEVVFEFLRMLILLTPIAVCFLIGDSFARYGASIFTSMVRLIGTFWLSIVANSLVYGIILLVICGMNPLRFLKDTSDVWTLAIATCSSSACIPVSLRTCKEKFNVPDHIADFCITVGGQLNSHGAALMYGCVVVFINQMYGLNMSIGELIQVVLVASLISSSGGGIPGSGIVKLSILVSTFGFPAEIVGIIAGFYRFFDMGTTGNVLGDVAGTVTVTKLEERRAKKRASAS